jgi:hypothetical protein
MILGMKTNLINQKIYIRILTTSILRCLKKKPNTCKNISPTCKYLNFIFQIAQILGPILVFVSSLKKHDYNNLTFEIYANKSLKIMYQKNIYYPHKIIYLIVLFFKDPNILWLTLLFMYILPCFHPIGVSFVVVVIWHHCDFFKGTFASHCLCFFHGHVCVMTSLLLLLVL